MDITVKNVKAHRDMSEETECFSCTLYVDGKKVGQASNHGTGGCNDYYFINRETEAAVNAYIDGLDPVPEPVGLTEEWRKSMYPMKQDLDWFVGELIADAEMEKRLRRLSKKNTLFRLAGESYDDGGASWRIVNGAPYCEAVQTHLDKKYGDKVTAIYGVTA
jgi:hypothetical protein